MSAGACLTAGQKGMRQVLRHARVTGPKRSRPRDRDRKGPPMPLAARFGKGGEPPGSSVWMAPISASRETCQCTN